MGNCLWEQEPLTGVTAVAEPRGLVISASERSLVGCSLDLAACCMARTTTSAKEVMVMMNVYGGAAP